MNTSEPAAVGNGSPPSIDSLVSKLRLDRLDRDLFLGDPGEGEFRLFGGMVAGQAVSAAYETLPEGGGSLHSLHAYFLRPGRYDAPVRYVVYRIRDGRTFTTRDVVAHQNGEAIFNLSCSFAKPEEGVTHQGQMPADVVGPDGMPPWEFVRKDQVPPEMHEQMSRFQQRSPVEMVMADTDENIREWEAASDVPRRRVWIRPRGLLPDDERIHAAVLAYASDMGLIATARMPHKIPRNRPGLGAQPSASLDHAIWFHHPPRFDDWLLYVSESPVAHAARALIFAELWARDGRRVASVVQEGLIRAPRP